MVGRGSLGGTRASRIFAMNRERKFRSTTWRKRLANSCAGPPRNDRVNVRDAPALVHQTERGATSAANRRAAPELTLLGQEVRGIAGETTLPGNQTKPNHEHPYSLALLRNGGCRDRLPGQLGLETQADSRQLLHLSPEFGHL
ncbi:hypothetical protein Taro_027530 [Colocasia esculenta]|uniref:Uncharacterized protein n=1 Tax=Colocasia esculenta TaxID=4460 RepID=A0A843VP18_COLES|nr:hypothetical protein [Colocasia esculenta]